MLGDILYMLFFKKSAYDEEFALPKVFITFRELQNILSFTILTCSPRSLPPLSEV
jgi:hypothetical protein